ncbi:NUDIX domain-containing protein [Streptomyces sp. NPDC006879]|uniref:NUDIX domain-containing protein n=1 Tax=Streptomyces sp. NPDC006879 TaxID=3364767 RepID=UPI0036929935
MKQKRSAGLLLFRREGSDVHGLEVLIGHMGGPLWGHRDAGAWSIPKGEYGPEEAAVDAARREFTEEVGLPAPPGPYLELGEVTQASGKIVTVWAVEADLDPALMVAGTFLMEWPRGSGVRQEFPELDRVGWFTPQAARSLLITSQSVFLDRLAEQLTGR